jgi:protoporphyrinogen oxidase
LFSPNNAPAGHSSIQAEIYFSDKYKPLSKQPEEYIKVAIQELIKFGLLQSEKEVVFKKAWLIPIAQVIYDHDRKEAVELVHNFLKENSIFPCGRYGDWSYAWTDESFISGENAAELVL